MGRRAKRIPWGTKAKGAGPVSAIIAPQAGFAVTVIANKLNFK